MTGKSSVSWPQKNSRYGVRAILLMETMLKPIQMLSRTHYERKIGVKSSQRGGEGAVREDSPKLKPQEDFAHFVHRSPKVK